MTEQRIRGLTDQKVVRGELTSRPTVGDKGLIDGGKTETKPSGEAKIIIRERELRPRRNSGEPVGRPSLPEAKEVR